MFSSKKSTSFSDKASYFEVGAECSAWRSRYDERMKAREDKREEFSNRANEIRDQIRNNEAEQAKALENLQFTLHQELKKQRAQLEEELRDVEEFAAKCGHIIDETEYKAAHAALRREFAALMSSYDEKITELVKQLNDIRDDFSSVQRAYASLDNTLGLAAGVKRNFSEFDLYGGGYSKCWNIGINNTIEATYKRIKQ